MRVEVVMAAAMAIMLTMRMIVMMSSRTKKNKVDRRTVQFLPVPRPKGRASF